MAAIRLVERRDHGQIVQFWHRSWHEAHATLVPAGVLAFREPEHFRIWLEQSDEEFYLLEESGVLGFGSIKDEELSKLFVRPEARGTGAAERLLKHGEQRLSENGVRTAQLFCTAGNRRAQTFYERHGWVLAGTLDYKLWLPDGVTDSFAARTHRYRKVVSPQP